MDKLSLLKSRFTIFAVAMMLGIEVKKEAGTVNVRCFKHEDIHPSLVLMATANHYECKSCGIKGDIFSLIQENRKCNFKDAILFLDPTYYDKPIVSSPKPVDPQDYLKSRGISKATQEKFNLTVDATKVTIPLSTGEKYRYLNGDNRYGYKTGTPAQIFKTAQANDKIILTEGELDAILLHQVTNYAVWSNTSGAGTFKDEWVEQFKGITKIFICYDNDDAGIQGANIVAGKLGKERCYLVSLPKENGKDVTDYFLAGKTKEDFGELMHKAKSFKANLLSRYKAQEEQVGFIVKTGFAKLDTITGGLRSRNSYLIAGLEKSGKSAFLLTIVNNMLCNNELVGYIDTELGLTDLSLRMASIYNDKPSRELDKSLQDEWIEMFQDHFFYAGVDSEDELKSDGVLSFDKTRSKVTEFAASGARVIIVDNLTVFSSLTEGNKKGWEVLSKSITTLINVAKEKNIILLFVVHTNESVVFTETPQGITNLLEQGNSRDIFKKSVTVTKKPRLADVFGGGAAHSQVSGTMLLWRPYQKFTDQKYTSMSLLILESFRHAQPSEIAMTFHGEKSTFTEDDDSLAYLR